MASTTKQPVHTISEQIRKVQNFIEKRRESHHTGSDVDLDQTLFQVDQKLQEIHNEWAATPEEKSEWVKEIIAIPRPLVYRTARLTMDKVFEVVADYFKVSAEALGGARRSRHIVYPRQVAFWLCGDVFGFTMSSVGRYVNRDHSTAIYGRDKIRYLRVISDRTKRDTDELSQKLREIESNGG